jgi:hypothetical protein
LKIDYTRGSQQKSQKFQSLPAREPRNEIGDLKKLHF